MSGPELAIIALIYIATLVLGQRGAGLLVPTAQEIGFAIAAIAGSVTAATFYQRRHRERASATVKVQVGLLMALLAVIVGFTTFVLWRSTLRPTFTLPIAAVATVIAPFLIFPIMRRFRDETAIGGASPPVGEMHVVSAIVAAVAILATAWFIPVAGRSNVRLTGKTYPSLFIGLPEWEAEQSAAMMDFGSIRLKDPRSPSDRFIALRWIDSDPVQPDEHVQTIAVGGLVVRDRSVASAGRHEATTYYLESDDHLSRAVATVWNCPQDHRVLWLFSYLSGPKSAMLATHEKILKTVRCHTGRNKEAAGAATQRIYPSFAAPPGFMRAEDEPANTELMYVGTNDRAIVFAAALPGRMDVTKETVSPAIISRLIAQWGVLQRIEGTPTLTSVNDLQGHSRRVWSIAGVTASSDAVQMELMIWYCDKRNLTFIARYATPRRHEPQEGINALLPAACHGE
jgi:hypothetical protein